MSGEKPEKTSGLSTRGAVIVGVGVALILGLAAIVGIFWPEIELRYYRHSFRHGAGIEQAEALRWICEHRLEGGMTREEVERILGESLTERFVRDKTVTRGISTEPDTTYYLFTGPVGVQGFLAGDRCFVQDFALCFESDSGLTFFGSLPYP